MRSRSSLVAALATAAASAALVAAPAAPAQAAPADCSGFRVSDQEMGAVCRSGTGEFRPVVVCRDEQDVTYYGSWVPAGEASGFRCPTLSRAISVTIEGRG